MKPDPNAPVYGIPPDLEVGMLSQPLAQETWHLPRSTWRGIRDRVTGKGTVCAVLDTGMTSHPALPKPLDVRSFISGESIIDGNGHGTHCCGTVLGRDEDIGVAMGADLVVGKVLSNRGSGSSSGIAAGVRWATELGVDVISMSLGGGSPYQPTINAIRDAMNAGIWVVIAAGNSGFSGRGNTIGWPARSNEGICTGATKQGGGIANFSSGGDQLTWACPGEQILSCSTNGGFRYMSGSSMATPFGAGLACLIIELMRREGNAAIQSRDAIHAFIKRTTKDAGSPGHDPSFGHGIPQADQIVQLLANDDLSWL
ncbi:Subtilisin DY [Novipirellula galeiformis]|uniref:Subtilisin DY n=1 Tax=Novipirellula galeiformis TaxID=2528004 RepID=A0A5C6CEE1_9BACT|nr:S8 family serine peptidase [Novipirellula galeiformis]TWU22472.1 Subtilisin DY [Novipirellula galeiformis]